MGENISNKEQIKYIGIGMGMGILFTILVAMLVQEDKIDSLIISGNQGEPFKFEIKTKQIQDTVILNSLWSYPFTKNGMIGWFKQKEFVHIGKDRLIIGDSIKQMLPKDYLSKRIITFQKNKEGPFQILSDSAIISVPEYYVPKGKAYTWKGSKYANDTILIADPNYNRSALTLICDDTHMGARNLSFEYGINFFHVNKDDYISILGDNSTKGTVYISITNN
ncbi:hypothetical protein AAFN75_17855 [Algibacter sp. AS12]|uniref:hypothetical protein n=1 Tax=Algibacter sp. AS12 TaxID=3135773 RepID=UPI00398A8D4F